MKLRSHLRRLAWPSIVAVLALLETVWSLAPPPRAWVERWYSLGFFPALGRWLVPAVDAAPFSLAIFAAAFAVILVSIGAAGGWRKRRKSGASVLRVLGAWTWRTFAVSVLGYALFLLEWGAGYGRERLETRLGLVKEPPTAEEVARWTERLTERIAQDAPKEESRDEERALESLRKALEEAVGAWDGRGPALPRRVKLLPAGSLLLFGTAGMTVPFFLEPHVDAGLHETELLAVSLHELAHVAGLCAEADADFAAAVAGLKAFDPYARYAVALWLFEKFASELPWPEKQDAYDALPFVAREDLKAAREANARYRVDALAKMQSRVYEAYLHSQRLDEGLREYSLVVRLLVEAERKGMVKP